MSTNKFVKGRLYRFLDYVLRLVLLNFWVVIPSFSILVVYSLISKDTTTIWFYLTLVPLLIWLFPSIVAVTDVIRQYEDEQTNTILKDFFKSLKRTYIKSFIIGLVIYVLIFLLYNSFQFFSINQNKDMVYTIGVALTISFMIATALVVVHIPLVLSYFTELSLIEYIKLALIMAFKEIGTTILIIISVGIVLLISIAYYFVMIIGGIAVSLYLIVKLSFKQYIKIYRKVEEND